MSIVLAGAVAPVGGHLFECLALCLRDTAGVTPDDGVAQQLHPAVDGDKPVHLIADAYRLDVGRVDA